MAEGGFDDRDPLLDHTDDRDDDEEEKQNPFQPVDSSTYGTPSGKIEMQTMQKEKSGLPKPDTSYTEETSFGGTGGRSVTTQEIEDRLKKLRDFNTGLLATKDAGQNEQLLSDAEKEIEIQKVKDFIKKEYPEVDFDKLREIRFARNLSPKSQLKLMDVVVVGPKGGQTKIVREDGSGLLKAFTKLDFVKNALGRKAIEINMENLGKTKQKRDQISKNLKEKEKELNQMQSIEKASEKLKNEMETMREKMGQIDQKITALEESSDRPLDKEEIDKLKKQKNDLQKEHQDKRKQLDQTRKAAIQVPKLKEDIRKLTEENATLNKTIGDLQEKIKTEDLNEKKQRKAELEGQNKEDQEIIDDEETSPYDKQAARDRVAERQEELNRLTTEIEEIERPTPLRERIKEIFKKYGVTVTAIFLAAGATIGAVIGTITNALKSMGKALGNGLKAIGEKTASLLPGLIGSIVSFLFKAAGQVVGFLAEHAWLLILAVVAFLVEGQIKKRR